MKYRREIDGLRALAVLPVMFFHAGFNMFSGGFVGVDVFFVISGYLITSIILVEKQAGTFSLIKFYERRARRILPALFLVVFVSLPFAWLWLLPSDMKDFSQSLVAVSAFASNILFLRESGYFDSAAELKPLLHLWSLAVEEQYYLLFPVFLLMTWRFGKKWIVWLLVVAATISLARAQWGSQNQPAATFYLLPTRGWELLIGAFIAFYFFNREKHVVRTSFAQPASFVGLLLILYAIFAFNKSTSFPGFYALVPTIGTALVILFANPDTLVGKVLGCKLFVGMGLISYSTYLWHHPLFVFARHRSLERPDEYVFLALSCISLGLACLTWRYVEQPFRNKGTINTEKIFLFSSVAIASSVSFGLIGHFNNGFAQRFDVQAHIVQSFESHNLRSDYDKNDDGKGENRKFCVLGDLDRRETPTAAIFGDSHSVSLLPAFDSAGKVLKQTVAHISLGGCPPLLGVDVLKGNYDIGVCEKLSAREYEYVKENKIKKVFLVSRWSLYTDGEYGEKGMAGYYLTSGQSKEATQEASRKVFESALAATVKAYRELGAKVYVVTQVPQQGVDPKRLYYKLAILGIEDEEQRAKFVRGLSVARGRHEALQHYTKKLFNTYGSLGQIDLVDLDEFLCRDGVCLMGDGNQSYYRDDDHLNTYGARLLGDEILSRLAE